MLSKKFPKIYKILERLFYPVNRVMLRMRLQMKIIFSILISLFVTITIIMILSIYTIHTVVRNQFYQEGKNLLKSSSFAVSYGLFMKNEPLVTPFLDGIIKERNILTIELYNKKGQLFAKRNKLSDIKELQPDYFRNSQTLQENEIELRDKFGRLEFIGKSYFLEGKGESDFIGFIRIIIDSTSIKSTLMSLIFKSLLFGLLAFMFGLAGAIVLGQRIIMPLNQMKIRLEAISRGEANLNDRLEIDSDDELGQMALAFNQVMDKLNDIILDIKSTAHKVNFLTASITEVITIITDRANNQANYIDQTTQMIKEFNNAAKSTSEDVTKVLAIARASSSSAVIGVHSVDHSREQMQDIRDKNKRATSEIIKLGKKSREIERIMQLITGIAVQSKVIAFNAAIEGAVSGTIGQRFGVVASQIRELANTVYESTREIKIIVSEVKSAVESLIIEFKDERESIQQGVDTINEATVVLNRIANESEQSVEMTQHIALATHQQTQASELLMNRLNDILQEAAEFKDNSIRARESIKEINMLTEMLLAEVERFTVSRKE